MRHDVFRRKCKMESDTSRRIKVHYVKQELPDRIFAIIRMVWSSPLGVECIDEIKLIDEGSDTIERFAGLMVEAIDNGADISIICPYDPTHVGMSPE